MATHTTLTTAKAWHPDQTAFLPDDVIPDALILQAATRVGDIEGDEPAVRVPWVADDGTAGFVPEGQPIPESDATYDETVLRTGKVATLGKFSREQLEQEHAATLVVNALQRSVVKAANEAFLANAADPTGLLNTPGIGDGGVLGDNLDPVADAITAIEADGGQATTILASPQAWGRVSTLKTGDGSAAPLVGTGVGDAPQRRLLGVDVLTTPSMPDGTLLVLDAGAIPAAVGGVRLDRSDDAYFNADTVGVRVTFRLGWAVMHPARLVRITTGDSDSDE